VQEPHPNLIVGGAARRGTLEPAARSADEYNTVFVGPEEAAVRRGRWHEACAAAGREPLPFSVMTGILVGADGNGLLDHARRVLARQERDADPEELIEEWSVHAVVGTTDEVRARLAEYERAGVARLFLQHLDHSDLDTVALLGSV
jgi:alkanesulfonate monooxygenase SsuD/methylene tetrahydromethanopterin reductase-like flavin-dependent oxidoreductase (luciferase family)